MPVKPLIRVIDQGGWKRDENKRFGAVVVGIFETYAPTGEIKTFHFAPTLEDLPVLEKLIQVTRQVDEHNKAILQLKTEVEGLESKRGEC